LKNGATNNHLPEQKKEDRICWIGKLMAVSC
jgi:hypothetical protein